MIRFFNFASSNQLNQLLSQPNPSLEEILDEECVVNEVRNSNHKLINFLCRKETFDSLISYITDIPNNMPYDPTESRKDEKINKYPYLACEILSTENDTLAQYFLGTLSDAKIHDIDTDTIPDDNEIERADSMNIEHPKEMQFRKEKQDSINEDTQMEIEFLPPIIKFVRFINAQPPINLTIAGYFAKVLRNLFFFKPAQMAGLLYEAHFKYLQRMAAHIYSDSIQELFAAILKLDNTYFKSEAKDTFIEKRVQLVQRTILNLFEKPNEVMSDDTFADLQTNSANLLVHLLLNLEGITNGHEIIAPLLEPQVLNKITAGLADPNLIAPLTPLLVELCEYEGHLFAPKKGMSLLDLNHYTEPVSQSEIPEDHPFLLAIIESVEVIALALEADNDKINPQEVPMQHGFSTFCFGKIRLNLLDLVNSYIKLQNEKMSMKMISCNLVPILLYLFVRNPWNSILHASLLKIFNFILVHGPETIIKASFEQGHILDFILEALKQSDFAINSKAKGKVTKGYTCYLHLLSNTIEECKFEYVQAFCRNHQAWQAYKESELREVNDKNNLKLGGEDAVSSTRSFSGFPRTTIYNNDNIEAHIPADEVGLNEAIYEEQGEEHKVDTDTNNVLGYDAFEHGGYDSHDLRGEIGVSPTHNGEFVDSDIMERHDSEVKYPHSVYVKSGFKSESDGGQNLGTLTTEPMESEQHDGGHDNGQETSQS